MNVNDECPNCKSGTLERNENDLVCQGECGATFNPLWMDDRVQFARLLCEMRWDFDHRDEAAAHLCHRMGLSGAEVTALFDRAAKVDIGPRGEFSRMVVGLIERAYGMGRKMGQSDMHEMLREAKLALTDGVEDKALVFLLKEIEETILPAPKCAEK